MCHSPFHYYLLRIQDSLYRKIPRFWNVVSFCIIKTFFKNCYKLKCQKKLHVVHVFSCLKQISAAKQRHKLISPTSQSRILGIYGMRSAMNASLLDSCASIKILMVAQRWCLFLPRIQALWLQACQFAHPQGLYIPSCSSSFLSVTA